MKRKISFMIVAAVLLLCVSSLLWACSGRSEQDIETKKQAEADASGVKLHKIGVSIYSLDDAEVQAFRDYYETYIADCFPDVQFIYSDALSNEEDILAFIGSAREKGVEGIISFVSYDLKAEVDLCAANSMYYLMGSGTVSDEAFASVEDNEYFLGVIGPGLEIEREAGQEMTRFFLDNDQEKKNTYLILSGGGYLGNTMHQARTEAMLETLAQAYGVIYDQPAAQIALSDQPVVVESNGLKLCVYPGYQSNEQTKKGIQEVLKTEEYNTVLSSNVVSDVIGDLRSAGAQAGAIDCFSLENEKAMTEGTLKYVTGKYGSMIGPSFAAMYNAVTGYAQDFRENGKAFKIVQGFWTAESAQEYDKLYALAISPYKNAYSYEDLYPLCKALDSGASFEKLKTLAEACTAEDVNARRN